MFYAVMKSGGGEMRLLPAKEKKNGTGSLSSIIWLAVCSALLLAGIIFAVLFKRCK